MTRIIAGRAGGVRLRTPSGGGTRPTSDRVREALFSALEARDAVAGARVLDLYAGSGALGLEAASRGAEAVCLVENARIALDALRANTSRAAAALRQPASALAADAVSPELVVVAASVPRWLSTSRASSAPGFDLVFVDPPYDLGEPELHEVLTGLRACLADDALVVVERSARSPEPGWPEGLQLLLRKKYGETVVWTGHWATPIPSSL